MNNLHVVTLGEVADLRAGFGFPTSLQGKMLGDYPFAKVGDISRASRAGKKYLTATDNYVDEGDLTVLKAKTVPPGSVLFAKIGEAIRQNHRVLADHEMLIDNNAMAAVPRESIEPEYLYRYLQTVDLYKFASSTTVPSLRKSELEKISVPLPRLAEQRRIAAILDHADALRAKRREALARLDELGDSVYADMFVDPSCHVRQVRLDEVSEIASGITKGRKVNGAPLREVPYLAVANVQDKKLDLTAVKTIEATDAEIARWHLQRNDLLLTEGGDPDKLGRGSLWREELPEAIHQNHVFRVRPDTSQVDPTYLNWTVGSRRGKAYFLRSAKQTTGIASINSTQLKAFPLELPPKDVQERFAQRIRAIDSMRGHHCTALAELDALFASIQSRAFRGEL